MNKIVTKQNEQKQLERLAAQREIFGFEFPTYSTY